MAAMPNARSLTAFSNLIEPSAVCHRGNAERTASRPSLCPRGLRFRALNRCSSAGIGLFAPVAGRMPGTNRPCTEARACITSGCESSTLHATSKVSSSEQQHEQTRSLLPKVPPWSRGGCIAGAESSGGGARAQPASGSYGGERFDMGAFRRSP